MLEERHIKAFVKGDRVGFDKIYEAYSSGMFAICLRYVPCDDDAKEVLQESFIKIYNARETFDTSRSIGAWIKTIVIRTALNWLKKQSKTELIGDESKFDVETTEIDTHSSDLKQKLKIALAQLPEGYRTIFNLYVIDNLTHKEIAEYLNISEGTSKSQYFKAKKMLQKLIQPIKIAS